MGQMMPDGLFGPVLVVTNPPVTYFVHYNYKTLVRIKKNSPRARTMRLASFGPVFIVSAHPVTYFVLKNIYIL